MHTATLQESLFTIAVDGRPSTRADVLPGWGPLDRLGVVVHEPFGAIGASYLLQLAITAFYDERPARRSREERLYPEVFVFHVGGRYGDHAMFDVFPARKEVFVGPTPMEVLDAVNDRGITRLAVPDRAPEPVQHRWKEPRQALDRLASAWAYTAGGRTRGGDVAITATSRRADANVRVMLQAEGSYEERQAARAAAGALVVPEDEVILATPSREEEVSPEVRDRIRDARGALDGPDGRTETYRTIDPRQALRMLHLGAAPAFV